MSGKAILHGEEVLPYKGSHENYSGKKNGLKHCNKLYIYNKYTFQNKLENVGP